MVKIGILGATSYTSLELMRLLTHHPEVEIAYLGSRRPESPTVSSIFPSLRGVLDIALSPLSPDAVPAGVNFLFASLPYSVTMELLPPFIRKDTRIVDLSADYRFTSPDEYKRWYGTEHKDPKNLTGVVYGLPELYREKIKRAKIVGNPGCYPTGAILPIAPLLKEGLCEPDGIIIDSKSGVSGAGRTPSDTTHFPECNESVHAYSIATHRHTGEMLLVLSELASRPVGLTFVPHLIPMDRGILTTAYVRLRKRVGEGEVLDVLTRFYQGEPFIRVRSDHPIRTKDVAFTNFCDVGCKVDDDMLVLVSAIDNLVKGASGQAIQNMNIMLGFDETEALL